VNTIPPNTIPPLAGALDMVDYDPRWPARFAYYRDELADILGPTPLRIDHIGSTAVPGLAAKDVVDLQVVVADENDVDSYRPGIESTGLVLGYRDASLSWSFFRPPVPPRLRHVHVTSAGSERERVQLLFVEYMRSDDRVRDDYARLKRRLAVRYPADRLGYAKAKTAFIIDMLDRAERWAAKIGWMVPPLESV
jgi:GrpB-like predicted nucleotidyltransferase (UPF0157 family)